MEICRRLGHGSPSCSCLVMHTMHTSTSSSRPPNIFKAYQAMQCNSVFDQILTNQSGDVSDHCSSVGRFTVSSNSSLLNFQLFTLGGFQCGILGLCSWIQFVGDLLVVTSSGAPPSSGWQSPVPVWRGRPPPPAGCPRSPSPAAPWTTSLPGSAGSRACNRTSCQMRKVLFAGWLLVIVMAIVCWLLLLLLFLITCLFVIVCWPH